MSVTRPSVRSTTLSNACPVWALPAAKANIISAVRAVHPIPSGLGLAWCPANRTTVD